MLWGYGYCTRWVPKEPVVRYLVPIVFDVVSCIRVPKEHDIIILLLQNRGCAELPGGRMNIIIILLLLFFDSI